MTAAAPSLELRKIADELERTTRLGLQTTEAYAAVCKVAAKSIRAALQADPVAVDRDALAQLAYETWRDTAIGGFPNDSHHPKWLAVVDAITTPPPTALQADRGAGVPIGYIDRKDVARLSNYKATIWPGTNEIDAVPVYTAAPAAMMPSLNIRCETARDGLIGSTRLHVVRVEPEDDGSFTAVTDYWPPTDEAPASNGIAEGAAKRKLISSINRELREAGLGGVETDEAPAKPKVSIELPDGDERTVKVWFTDWLNDGAELRVSIQVTDEAPAKGGDTLLSECYLAMRDAMKLIDPNGGEGREHSRVLNALAAARVAIENRAENKRTAT